MTAATPVATVPKDLEDLIPTFLENRRKELGQLQAAIEPADLGLMAQLGHRMRGVGSSYGFDAVTTFGAQIETAAKAGDLSTAVAAIEGYARYLAAVKIVYE